MKTVFIRSLFILFFLLCVVTTKSYLDQSQGQQQSWQQKLAPMYQLHRTGKKEEALSYALVLMKESESFSHLDLLRIEQIHHVGWLNYDLKRYSQALQYLTKSLSLYKERERAILKDPSLTHTDPDSGHGVGNELELLGEVYFALKNNSTALNYFKEAELYYGKSQPGSQTHISTIKWQAAVYKSMGMPREADAKLKQIAAKSF